MVTTEDFSIFNKFMQTNFISIQSGQPLNFTKASYISKFNDYFVEGEGLYNNFNLYYNYKELNSY